MSATRKQRTKKFSRRKKYRKSKTIKGGNINKYKISVGILSYFAPKTLDHTLKSYRDSGFLDIIDDLFVVIQISDRQKEEEAVCKTYNIKYILLPDNGNIASGFKIIYDNAKHEILLFLENDFIIENKEEVSDFLKNAVYFLKEDFCDVVRCRSRNNSGVPNYAKDSFIGKSSEDIKNSIHLSEIFYIDTNPEKTYPDKIKKIDPTIGDKPWYITSSRYCNYTNNPCMYKRQFIKDEILPHLVYGENIEDRITTIWSSKNYRCVFGPGLFTHDRKYDGKI